MSKITDLRRKATEASRSRKWDEAVKLYERICDLEGANPGYRNELGDVFAKKGDIPSALANFEKAVGLYNAVGLSNNAVAVLKKILRYDPQNMDSHWLLGETRRKQGLDTDATSHYLHFLDTYTEITDATRERFLDRSSMLLEDIPLDLDILGRLDTIFEEWKMEHERARVMVCKAKLARESGEEDMVQRYVERAQTMVPDLSVFPEYGELFAERAAESRSAPVVEIVDEADTPAAQEAAEPRDDLGIDLEFDMPVPSGQVDAAKAAPTPGDSPGSPAGENSDFAEFEEFCDTLTDDDASHAVNLDQLRSRFASGEDSGSSVADDQAAPAPAEGTPAAAEAAPAAAEAAPAPAEAETGTSGVSESVNLLEEILADQDVVSTQRSEAQVETIGQDIGAQMGGDVEPEDYHGHYDLGLVYMDMGMYVQALPSFAQASRGEQTRLKAMEMAGNCLRKLERHEDALVAYRKGLAMTGLPPRQYLGLLYEVASCLEALGQSEEALESYERVAYLQENFLDVNERMEALRQRT